MDQFRPVLLSLVVVSVIPNAASAQAIKNYSIEGDWEIAVNQSMGPACVAIQRFTDPDWQIRIGIDARSPEQTGYFTILLDTADGVTPGQEVPASFDVDGHVFTGTFVGPQAEGFERATVHVDDPQFIYDLSRRKTLTISYGKNKNLIIDLARSASAVEALRSCQEAQQHVGNW